MAAERHDENHFLYPDVMKIDFFLREIDRKKQRSIFLTITERTLYFVYRVSKKQYSVLDIRNKNNLYDLVGQSNSATVELCG